MIEVSVRCNCQLGKWILAVNPFLSLDSARSFSQTAQENIDLQTTILSRFDLIFIVKDERNHEKDMVSSSAGRR
jgi:DNA replicative helicase MCM subunit Mcm2 (Cdc46/Mcm family)